MWDNATITMLLEGTRDTLYMTLVSAFFGYVLGLPLGILLAVTDKEGIHPNAAVYKVLDVIVNILRSIPFLILLILVIPLTRLLVGKTYGSTATIVPLVIAAAPFIARMVESSLKEVDRSWAILQWQELSVEADLVISRSAMDITATRQTS